MLEHRLLILLAILLVKMCETKSDMDILKEIFDKGYDWRVRPHANGTVPGTRGPVVVTVNMLIRNIRRIDDVNMEYNAEITFREQWMDKRLEYYSTSRYINVPEDNLIWRPDTFFQNELKAHRHTIEKPNVLTRVYRDGRVLYSVRLSMLLECPMSLQAYPFDVQMCFIDLSSYAYNTDDIEYKWKSSSPIQQKRGLRHSLPNFELASVNASECTAKTNTGTYSCLRARLELKRQFGYFVLQYYIPSIMLVLISWVSFWIKKSAVTARILLILAALITMTAQATVLNSKLPAVSYTKAIDVWTGTCLAFIFAALLQCATVNYLDFEDSEDADVKSKKKTSDVTRPEHGPTECLVSNRREPIVLRKVASQRIDCIARLLFPIAFLIFNIIYWISYI